MIVDDSIVARAVLSRMIGAHPDLEVVAQAGSGRAALALLGEITVDLILLDLEMPGMGGLEALPDLIRLGGGARVLIVSSACGEGACSSISALRLGAADTLLKPGIGGLGDDFEHILIDRLRRIAATPTATPLRMAGEPPTVPPEIAPQGPIGCVAIGASTGGVHALAAFFAAYPQACDAPILVTQHLPAPFMPYFVGQLHEMAGRPARLAADGMAVTPGTILLAPGDAHLSLASTRGLIHVRLERRRADSGCLPSVDPMMEAVARLYGPTAIGVILSGMGRDGLAGARILAAAGGEILAQDAPSSVVWGMPGSVVGAGLARVALPPAGLARRIARRHAQAKAAAPWN